MFKQFAVLFLLFAPCASTQAEESIPLSGPMKRVNLKPESNETRELAIAAIKSHGAKIEFAADLPNTPIISVTFISCHMKAEDLVHLEALPEIQHLALSGAAIANADLIHLAGLKNLLTLDVSNTKIDDAGLKHVCALTSLRTLNLEGTAVTHGGLVYLYALTHLESLNLCFTREELSDEAVVHLRKLKKLKKLDVSFSALTDDGLNALIDLSELESLNLENSKVTDAGVKAFQMARPTVTIAP